MIRHSAGNEIVPGKCQAPVFELRAESGSGNDQTRPLDLIILDDDGD
jgi:hypothetical protein